MDHLPLPSDDLAHGILQVPLLEDFRFQYDGLGMTSYPERVRINVELLACDRDPTLKLPFSAAFLQAWLWFGILHEWCSLTVQEKPLRTHELAVTNFSKVISGQRVVTCENLSHVLSTLNTSNDDLLALSLKSGPLLDSLKTLCNFTTKATRTLYSQGFVVVEGKRLPNILLVLLSSQILCQTLIEFFQPSLNLWSGLLNIVNDISESSQIVDGLLTLAGWCPKEIGRLPKSIIFRYYLSHIRQIPGSHGPNHRGFDECTCTGIGEDPDTDRSPVHTHELCQCNSLSIPSIYNNDTLPTMPVYLFRLSRERMKRASLELRTIDINDLDDNFSPVPFVAVSHVRKLGLWNVSENSLPHCQLVMIQSLVEKAINASDGRESTFFWIDTLGLPTDRSARKRHESYLWRVFKGASKVLVIDPGLFHHIYATPEEALIRIRYSGWKRRLWTLEEGFFANDLLFCFQNTMVSLDDLLDKHSNTASRLPILRLPNIPQIVRDLDPETLSLALIQLSADMHLASILGLKVNTIKLYHVLRIGYLSAKKFAYFTEQKELDEMMVTWPRLLKIYANPVEIVEEPDTITARLSYISI